MFNDIFIFIAIVETGSMIGAAKKLGMSQATVSRRLQSLEDDLGFKLIMRSTRNFELTDIGKILYDGVKDQQEHLNSFIANLSARSKDTAGRLRISLPTVFSYDVISPYIPEFLQNHPEVTLEICYQNRNIDVFKERLDLAIVNYRPSQQTLKMRHLFTTNLHLYCTSKYVAKYGMPKTLDELKKHLHVGILDNELESTDKIELLNMKTGKIIVEGTYSRIFHNNSLHSRPMIMSNEIIGGGWDILFKEELAQGKIEKVLPNYSFGELSFYLIRLHEHNTELIRAFIDFLDECFARIGKE